MRPRSLLSVALLGAACSLFPASLYGAASGPVEAKHATVELLSETTALVPGETAYLGLRFDLEEHWHIYWKNPGASGLPVSIDWTLPEGVEAGLIKWPAPSRIALGDLTNYGYEGEVTLLIPLRVSESVSAGREVTVRASADWLICKEVCLPGEADLALDLPVAAGPAGKSPSADVFAAARERLPEKSAPWSLSGGLSGEQLRVRLRRGADSPEIPPELYFYAGEKGVVDPNAAQTLQFSGPDEAVLAMRAAGPFRDSPGDRVGGVLQSPEGAWAVSFAVDPEGLRGEASSADGDAGGAGGGGGASGGGLIVPEVGGVEGFFLELGPAGWVVLAFAGGLILNIMPCVLPVLALKVFSLLKHSGQSRGRALLHGSAYTGGVVASFLVLGGVLFGLRALGEQIGWGFQLQSPSFVVVLAVLFFVFGLNLMGVFELGGSLTAADAKVSQRRDLAGSFGMGILAAVVGAPCMGPMVASVSGIAVQTELATGLLIFGFMGLGLASPFLFLSIFPKLVEYLPKPGAWMESFKQLMGFLLMAAVLFLVWVLGRQTGVSGVMALLIGLLVAGAGTWVFGRWGSPARPRRIRWLGRTLGALTVAAGLMQGLAAAGHAPAPAGGAGETGESRDADGWAEWSRERVRAELAEGNPVFVDFTATWCLICQVNKKTTLRTDAVRELFAAKGIVPLEADWTRRDPAITRGLERFGRSGVPLYVLHVPDGEPRVLPQQLTPGIVREAVEKALP